MADRKAMNNEQAILSRFQELRNEISQMGAKANEMAAESQEHELVLKALEPMEGTRKCYRVVDHLYSKHAQFPHMSSSYPNRPIPPSHGSATHGSASHGTWVDSTNHAISAAHALGKHMFHTTCSFVS